MEKNQAQEATLIEKEEVLCPICGAVNEEGHAYCANCGASMVQKEKRICTQCGMELQPEQMFCPKCGKKYGEEPVKPKKNKKTILILAIIAAALLIIGIALFFIIRGTPVSYITLNRTELVLDEGESATLICTVNPGNAKNKSLVWKTSNSRIVTVSEEGEITAVAQGVCTVTVQSNNGKTDECTVTVNEHIPNFKELYSSKEGNSYVSIASDGDWMKIDSNPTDKDNDDFTWSDYTLMNEASSLIEEVNSKLGFSSSVYQKMVETTSIQGRQSEEISKYKVSWTYHPDNGLEVMYEVNNAK